MSHSIITVTLNPAIDETITLDELKVGEVHRAKTVRFNAGGKGINVASCLADYGIKVAVTGFLGSDNAMLFEKTFAEHQIDDCFVRLDGTTRTNIKLVTNTETTDINLSGLSPDRAALKTVRRLIETAGSEFLVLAGSLPPGCPDEFYADLVAIQDTRSGRSIVDCSGSALSAVLAAPCYPFAIKPNIHELSEWAGRRLETVDDILQEAVKLHKSGLQLVVISMGAKGALFVSRQGAISARLPLDKVESTVGAGDAMVAGLVAALVKNASLEDTARLATAFATGKLQKLGPSLPSADVIDELARATHIQTLF